MDYMRAGTVEYARANRTHTAVEYSIQMVFPILCVCACFFVSAGVGKKVVNY